MRKALVEFHHGRGCDLGMPYGGCSYNCRWDVVEFLPDDPPPKKRRGTLKTGTGRNPKGNQREGQITNG